MWDATKQTIAMRGAFFYLHRIQKSESLLTTMRDWCEEQGLLSVEAAEPEVATGE